MPMPMREFIKVNRATIDGIINQKCPNVGKLNDADRREWIANDEGLYLWAKREGVRV